MVELLSCVLRAKPPQRRKDDVLRCPGMQDEVSRLFFRVHRNKPSLKTPERSDFLNPHAVIYNNRGDDNISNLHHMWTRPVVSHGYCLHQPPLVS